MMNVEVNYVAVLLAAVAAMVIGYFWYSPTLFADTWVKSMGKKMSDLKATNMNQAMALMFVGALIEAYVLKHMLSYAGAHDIMGAATGAFWIWLGFVAPLGLSGVLFEGKTWNWYYITVGCHLVTLLVMAGILVSL